MPNEKSLKSQVSIVRGNQMEFSIRKALDLIGGIGRAIRPGDTVLIKPNFGVNVSFETGVITDPRVIDILIPLCMNAGPRRLLVGESTVVGLNTAQIFRELGLEGRFERLGATMINLDQDEIVEVPVPGGSVLKKLRMYRTAYESDVIISVPTMKTHILTGVSLGLKNIKGTLPDKMKKLMHRIGVEEKVLEFELEHAIADLNSVKPPSMTIIDGFIANEGYKPGTPGIGGTPLEFNMVVTGLDPVAVDAVGAYLMGFEPWEVRHISYAGVRKIGVADLHQIEVLGAKLDDLRRPFKRPSMDGILFDFKNVSIVAGKGCSGCREATLIGLTGMTESELEKIGKAVLVVGANVKLSQKDEKKRPILVGNCTLKMELEGERIEGCPPPGIHVKRCLLGEK
jgi:uncharacterized protein (DUF362 family)